MSHDVTQSRAEPPADAARADEPATSRSRRRIAAQAAAGAVLILTVTMAILWKVGVFAPSSVGVPGPLPEPVPIGAGPSFPGTLYYRDEHQSDPAHDVLADVVAMAERSVVNVIPGTDYNVGRARNVAFSPDGRWMAWLPTYTGEATQRPEADGDLIVARTDRSEMRVLGHRFVHLSGPPVWSPDATRILAQQSAPGGPLISLEPDGDGWGKPARLVTVELATGAVTAVASVPANVFSLAWSGDGRTIAYTDNSGRVFLIRADGTPIGTVPGLQAPTPSPDSPFWMSHQIWSLSPDGTRIALSREYQGGYSSDPPADARTNVILDTATGRPIALPVPGQLQQAFYTPQGQLLLRMATGGTNRLVLLAADGKVLASSDEPSTLASLQLFAYVAGPAPR